MTTHPSVYKLMGLLQQVADMKQSLTREDTMTTKNVSRHSSGRIDSCIGVKHDGELFYVLFVNDDGDGDPKTMVFEDEALLDKSDRDDIINSAQKVR